MTTKNIQDVVAEIIKKYDVRYFDGSTYLVNEEFEKDLTQLVKEVEAGSALAVIGEAIELVNRHDPMANKKSNPNYWGNTLRKDLATLEQSLQDNK